MSDVNSPDDGEAVDQGMPQMPEAKPFTLGKTPKKAAMPRAELSEEAMPPVSANSLTTAPPLAVSYATGDADQGRANVFTSLVRADGDIVGLVAYSIHKQNEHDWLLAFTKANSRPPDNTEIAAYLLGENTPRRLATYRHLAAATLAGNGPEVPAGADAEAYAAPANFAAARYLPNPPRSQGTSSRGGSLFAYLGLAVVFIVAIVLAARYGLPGISH